MSTKRLFFAVLLTAAAALVLGNASTTRGEGNAKDEPAAIESTLSYFLSPEERICCGNPNDQKRPAVAYNRQRTEYIVVQHETKTTNGTIVGEIVGLDGNPYRFFLISGINNDDCCLNPDVAFNATDSEYLVVWQQYNQTSKNWEIYGRRVPWDGTDFTIAPILIAKRSGANLKYPKVAWNSYRNEYMVVWHTENASNAAFLGVERIHLGANGGKLHEPGYISITNAASFPDIAYNVAADQYVMVWSQIGAGSFDIYRGKLSREGFLQGSYTAVANAARQQMLPVITTNEQDRYLVVWQDERWDPGDWDIYAQFLDVNANPVGGNFWLNLSTADETSPAVSSAGAYSNYLVVYEQTTLSGTRIMADYVKANGDRLEQFEVIPGAGGDNDAPAVASHGAGYFIAYEWESWGPGTHDIYGRIWSPYAGFIPMIAR